MPLLQTPPLEVTVTAAQTAIQASGVATYVGNVKVRYGTTTITADRVVVHRNEAYGVAEGNVTVVTPAGSVHPKDAYEFGWDLSQITITASKPILIQASGVVTYEGDVTVRYGGTKLVADRVTVYKNESRGVAEGNVTLIDPDGTAHADRLEFGWLPSHRFAKGENVEIRVQGAFLKARRADLQPGEWTLLDVEGTSCLRPKPVYLVTSDLVKVYPQKSAYIHQPRVSLLGRFLAELPTQRPQLSPAVPGIHLPTPAYKFNQGLGVTWSGGTLAGHDATFTFDARAFQSSKPSASALYTKSYLPIQKATQIVAPQTDFAERFDFGYLDSVLVDSPAAEMRFLDASRASLSGGGQLNGSVVDRDRHTRYSKVEAVYEGGKKVEGFGLQGQVRAQGLQREDDDMEPRVTLAGTLEAPSRLVGKNLRTLARLDSSSFVGRTLYGWGRGMVGLTYAPASWLRLSAAGFASFDAGKPQFDIDPLYSEGGGLFRADVAFAGTRLSLLSKNDVHRGSYDTEFSINQVIGCVEVYYILRGYPRRSQIGLELRIQPLTDLLNDAPTGASRWWTGTKQAGSGRPAAPRNE